MSSKETNLPDYEDIPALAAGFEVDRPRIERAVREILLAIGENPDREGLL